MIDILLPVYNGEKYLSEQIDSILSQSYCGWNLIIRNDGSTDNSQSIIDMYCAKHPSKITCIKEPEENLGLIGSINVLLNYTKGDYIMFSDHDDVWLQNKIEITLSEMQKVEKSFTPAMVCTDVACINEQGDIINESFFHSMRFCDGIIGNPHKMLALNVVQGSTIMINKFVLPLIKPLPRYILIHDMYIAVLTAYYGKAYYSHKVTMLYRQHEHNTVGAIKIDMGYFLARLRALKRTLTLYKRLKQDLPFKISLTLVFMYKVFFSIKRILKK